MYGMIHRFVLIFCVLISFPVLVKAQGGNWVWVNGSSNSNSAGVFGIQGTASPLNSPPASYEAVSWTDNQGNFWVFGGYTGGGQLNDLWKYNPAANTWTWMKGLGATDDPGSFGVLGVPSITNNPSARAWGTASWTDATGDLWLYGGRNGAGSLNDLWRYNIASNEWTWMGGTGQTAVAPVYGLLGVAQAGNNPGGRNECTSAWVDDAGNLWLFGGFAADLGLFYNDVWKYNISSGLWTWVNGSSTPGSTGNYGSQGVPSASNEPSARATYINWKDQAGNFYIFGGFDGSLSVSDVWKYSSVNNLWTWVAGDNYEDANGNYNQLCTNNGFTGPMARYENRAAQTALCHGNAFYSFGGAYGGFDETTYLNDLWVFNSITNNWILVSGSAATNSPGNYGNLGVTGVNNMPPARSGHCIWMDNNSNLWVFGGTAGFVNFYNDIWKFVPNPACITVNLGGGLLATPAQSPICIGDSTVLTITGGDSLQIWPATGTRFTDSTHVMVKPDTTTTYIVTGHSSCQHNDTTWVTIQVIKPGKLVYQLSDTNICGTASVILSLTGQANNQINPLTGVTIVDSATYRLAPPVTTTYRLTGTSTLCGVPDTGMFTIHVRGDTFSISAPQPVCSGANISVSVTGFTSFGLTNGYYYNSTIYPDSVVFYPLYPSGTFPAIIIAHNSCGAIVQDTLQLTWILGGSINFSATKTIICPGDSTLLTVSAPPVISVTPSASVTWVNSTQAWLKPDSTTGYTISSSATCLTVDSGFELVTVLPQAHAAFTLTSQVSGAQTLITLTNQSTGYTTLSWYHDSTLLELTNNTVTTTDTGNYCITLVAMNTEGCDDAVTHCIEIAGQSYLQVPQAFTPNGDGVNDYFTVFGQNLTGYQIRIFNRWGEEVYSSNDLNELNNLSRGWNGTYKGKLQDPASFTWVIKASDGTGNTVEKNGYVILIR